MFSKNVLTLGPYNFRSSTEWVSTMFSLTGHTNFGHPWGEYPWCTQFGAMKLPIVHGVSIHKEWLSDKLLPLCFLLTIQWERRAFVSTYHHTLTIPKLFLLINFIEIHKINFEFHEASENLYANTHGQTRWNHSQENCFIQGGHIMVFINKK